MNSKKMALVSKCIFLIILSISEIIFAQDRSSDIIAADVNLQPYLSDKDKNIELAKRLAVQSIQNSGISTGLYLQGLPTIGGVVNPVLNIINTHFSAYCDQATNNEGGNEFSCQADPVLAFGDVKVATLLTGSRYNDAQLKAAQTFMQNLIDPFPKDTFANPQVIKEITTRDLSSLSPEKRDEIILKQKEYAQALANQAALTVARQPFAEMIAKRSPTSGDAETMMQKMEREAGQRFLNPEWQNSIATAYAAALKNNPSQAVQYDIVILEAYRTWLEFERYKQGERIEALLGVLVQQNVVSQQRSEELRKQSQTLPTAVTTPGKS